VNEGSQDLLLPTLALVAALVIPRLAFRAPVWLRWTLRTATVALLTFLMAAGIGSPFAPRFDTRDATRLLWQQVVEAGWWVVVGGVGIATVRLFIVLKNRPRETRILSDLVAGVITVATVFAVTTFAFSFPLGGLLATSGVIAIVLGLALQSTLSDVFSGIAVGLERPYKAGDLLWVEGNIEGRVIQVNWRSTHIGTIDGNVAVVPNSIIAKARLINRSSPTPQRNVTVEIKLHPHAIPEHCATTLTAAAFGCSMLLDEPLATVACTGLQGDALSYQITFSVPTSSVLSAARDELYAQVHRHLRHAGIALAIPGKGKPRPMGVPTVPQLLGESELFGSMEREHRDYLAGHFTTARIEAKTVVFAQGETPDALFLIASGTMGVTLPKPGKSPIINRLGPGETLGAVGLVTGSPFTATASALTPMKLYRLDRDHLVDAVSAKPELALAMEALAERVIYAMRRDATMNVSGELGRPEVLMDKFRNFLRLLSAQA
jgi:small-conductance mechanosensitive channel/CRP-like cAMP-binding protein